MGDLAIVKVQVVTKECGVTNQPGDNCAKTLSAPHDQHDAQRDDKADIQGVEWNGVPPSK